MPETNFTNRTNRLDAIKSKIIFVTGGVISGLGKGITSSSVAYNLKKRGYKVTIKKMDPYLNIDPGTMNPSQHGEVFVTNDGLEADLDLGHYERFAEIETSKDSNITSGKIYEKLLADERRGDYLGKTVQVIPHVTNIMIDFILKNHELYDFIIVEIGGTVGDIEGQSFLESARQIYNYFQELQERKVIFVHLTYIPYLLTTKEIKTKPTQHSVRTLMSFGIKPDILICRTHVSLDIKNRTKISLLCNVPVERVIEAKDFNEIYQIPASYEEEGVSKQILNLFRLPYQDLTEEIKKDWGVYFRNLKECKNSINIYIPGKYLELGEDSYKSLSEAVKHAAYNLGVNYNINWVDIKSKNYKNILTQITKKDCIIIPGGFGEDGIEGKVDFIKFARENNISLLGICYGMQLSVIEFLSNVAGLEDCNTTEIKPNCKNKVIDIMYKWISSSGKIEKRTNTTDLGGTLRLGSFDVEIVKNSLAEKIYKSNTATERHRHRYDVNIEYREVAERHGGVFSGFSKLNNEIPEIFEIKTWQDKNGQKRENNFFIGCQYHPEFLSKPRYPHPLFTELLKSVLDQVI
jgi:CTP synthase